MAIATVLGDGAGIAGVIVGVLGIGVSVFLGLRMRQRKGLSYRLTTPRVVNVRPEAEESITILYGDKPVGDVKLVNLRIVSSGNLPVTAADFERPFSVELGVGAQVLTHEVARASPPDLAPDLTVVGSRLVIEPLLLNPGDVVEITALVSDLSEADRLDGRIAGIPSFVNLGAAPAARQTYRRWLGASVPATFAGLAATATATALAGALVLVRNDHTNSRIALKTGPSLCGDVVRVGERSLVVKLKDGGLLRTVALNQVRAIEDNSC